MYSRNYEQFDLFAGNYVGEKPNYVKSKIDPRTEKNRVTDMYWKMDGTTYGELSFNKFISRAITEMKRERRYGYVRLFLYPTEKEFGKNQNKYFAIFIRKRDIYVVGLQYVNKNVYEIRRVDENERYLYNSTPTGFRQEYSELFQGTGLNGDLVGAWIGFYVLNQAILRVIRKKNPCDWAWSIGVFALTFSECIRFVWSLRKLSNLFDYKKDIRMEGDDEYLAKLPKKWKTISDCARRNLEPNEPTQPQPQRQPEDQKYSMEEINALETCVRNAIDSLNIQSWDYHSYCEPVEAEPEGGRGFGDGRGRDAYVY